MGFGYADKLTYREDLGGSLGDPELTEAKDAIEAKVEHLAALVRHISVHAARPLRTLLRCYLCSAESRESPQAISAMHADQGQQ